MEGKESYQEVTVTNEICSWTSTVSSDVEINLDAYVDPRNYIMVNPDLKALVKKEQKGSNRRKDLTEHYLYFCSTITHLQFEDRRFDDCEYVPINRKIMSSIISFRYYSKIVADLQEWGVVVSDGIYQEGNKSLGFKLQRPFNEKLKCFPVKDKLLNEKLTIHKVNEVEKIVKLSHAYQYLATTNTWIEMDYQSAYAYNEIRYVSSEKEKVYPFNNYSIESYAEGLYRFKVDDFGNRVHTNLTSLKSDFRQFLYVDGKPLGQIDITNSQPLFFYLHIRDIPNIPQSEKDRYREIVESGLFYEFFMTRLDIPMDHRKDVKNKILTAIFSDKIREKESRYFLTLRTEFPSIADYIYKVRNKDYKRLVQLLQRAESNFIIEKVVARFMDAYGQEQRFISTIHDCIVVQTEMLYEAQKIMKECFQSEGVQPKMTLARYDR